MQTAPPQPRKRIDKAQLTMSGTMMDGWISQGVFNSDPQSKAAEIFRAQAGLLRTILSESEPDDEGRELYQQQLSLLTEWTQQPSGAASRKRSRSATSPSSKKKKHRVAVNTDEDITEEPHTEIEEPGLIEGSGATKDVKMDFDGGVGDMMNTEDLALGHLQDTAGVEAGAKDLEMADQGSSKADKGPEAWNFAAIEAMGRTWFEGNKSAQAHARVYLASSYYEDMISVARAASRASMKNKSYPPPRLA